MIFVDTNVLARTVEKGHPQYQAAVDAVSFLRVSRAEALVISPQVLMEFYAASTRRVNGLGLTAEQALSEIALIKQQYALLSDHPSIFSEWEQLVQKYKPVNRLVFDTRHVAFMRVYQLTEILTFNDKDFSIYSEIQPLNPFDILKRPRV